MLIANFQNIKPNQRGNVMVFLVIAIILLIFIILMTGHRPVEIAKDINTESKVKTITTEAVTRALRQGLQRFTKGGYSLDSGDWVCNQLMPPLANEIDSNFAELMRRDLNGIYFKTIKEELGYKYGEGFKISLGLKTTPGAQNEKQRMLSLPNNRVDINANFILVETEAKNEKERVENSLFVSLPYRKWLIYKKLIEWGENYLPILGEDVCTELTKAHPCLLSACGPPNAGVLISDKKAKSFVDLSKINIDWAIAKQLNYLNSVMKPFNIECEYIKKSETRGLIIARRQICDRCNYPCFLVSNLRTCGSWEGKAGLGCPAREPLGPWVLPPGAPPEGSNTVSCPLDLNKHEAVALNSHVFFSFDFICKDNTKSISMGPKLEKSTAIIGVVVGITRTCPPTFMCPQ